MRLLNKTSQLQTYVIGIVAFFVIITFLPILKNLYFLPKLTLIQIGGCILFLSEAFRLFISKKNERLNSLDVILFLFLIINLLAWIFSSARLISFFGIYQNEGMNLLYLPALLIIAGVFRKLKNEQKDTVYLFIIAGTLLSSIYTVIHYYSFANNYGIVDRPNGLDGHPIWSSSTIGFGLLLLLFFPLSLIQNRANRIYIKIIGSIIHATALFYLFSTTAAVTLLLTFIGYWMVFIIKIYKKLDLKKILLIVFAIAVVGLIFLRFAQIKSYSIQRRLTELTTTIKLFKSEYISSPDKIRYFFLGHGQNTTGFNYIQHKDPRNMSDKEWLINLTQLHNQFLELFFTIGLVGMLAWFYLFVGVILCSRKTNDKLLFVLSLYLFLWQQLYVLLPTGMLFSMLIISYLKNSKISFTPSLIFQKYFVPGAYVFFTIFLLYMSVHIVYADYLFAQNDVKKAIKVNLYNDEYIRNYTNELHSELIRCQPSKPDPSIPDCPPAKLKKYAKEEFALLNKAVVVNPLNASNWNGLSASAFVLSFLEPENKKYYRNESLKAGIQTYHFNPTEAWYADGLGLIYLELQDYGNAQKYLEIAHILKPDSFEITKHLMEVYKQTNNQKKLLLK